MNLTTESDIRKCSLPVHRALGLFPTASDTSGGLQLSGAHAWEGIVGHLGAEHAYPVFYEAGSSKLRAVLTALRAERGAQVVLVWHLDLLKLLPALDLSVARVALFLHGIEAWRKQDVVTRLLMKRVDRVLANSEHTWSRFVLANPAFRELDHRIVHLGTGSSLESVVQMPHSPPAVLMVGRLDRREAYKGQREVIGAWPEVLARLPNAELWIVGSGDLRPDLERAARDAECEKFIRFFGRVSDAEKDGLLAKCRCLALPSRGEGFGLVYLEAMRLGRPCLVGNADAGREVVNPPEAGLAVDPDDRQALAAAVCRLLTRGAEWDRWSADARARYEANFTAQHFRQRLLAALFDS